ncbi:MAG: DUF1080 domain-containing protein [Bacteroidetes bacterium]|jgi:HEAT repeat protein|nr:DUF1080 domain-containing protein [Bacteroidota bacterium]MBT4402234.1 DUF1080 domain-containing protein [Bacteroidota bacterium]MBT4411346.1 DUF1080 domain-containing protein [Bacteroidota bacterium]MBT7465322.1 DUF1080 domain-containing protein [Bacteroidota bacterium]
MKNINNTLVIILLAALSFSAYGQDKRTLETKVADVLTQMPAHDLSHRDRLMNDMINLGEDGLFQFTDMIVAPGTGDDTKVRFALGDLSKYVGRNGKEEARIMVSNVFIKALENKSDKEIKAFFFYHLNFFAKDEAVPVAVAYLNDERLNAPAVALLHSIAGHKAVHALADALPSLDTKNKITVVKAIGEMGQLCGLEAVTPLIDTNDSDLKHEVLYALAEIADLSSSKLILNAAKEAAYKYENTQAMPAMLRYAERLGEKGELEVSEKICELLMKKCKEPEQLTYALNALSILVDQQGYEVLELLLEGIKHPNKEYRGAVLLYAGQINDIGATRKWMALYPDVAPPIQAELMQFFGQQGDLTVMPLVMKGMRSDAPCVRNASVVALGKLKGSSATGTLLSYMEKASDVEVKTTQAVLNTLVGPAEIELVADHFEGQNPAGKVALLELFANRQATSYYKLVRKNVGSDDPQVQKAAYKALAAVSDSKNMKSLLNLLYMSDELPYLEETQAAIISSAQKFKTDHAKPVLDAYSGATKNHDRFIGIFPSLGGPKALKTVAKAFSSEDNELKKLAFEALSNWKDYSASSALFDICKEGSREYQKQAFTGYVRQVKKAPVHADQKRLLLRKVMPLAKNADQKKLVINALGGNKTFLTLTYLSRFLDDSQVANEAGRAIATVALPPSGSKEGMYGDLVKEILNKAKKVISGEESDYIKANITRWIEEMPEGEGYTSMFNGNDLSGWKALVGNPVSRAKMTEKELAKAQAEANALMSENWEVVDGEIRFIGTGYKNLCSNKDYADFEFLVDWKINDKGDSGIYLRGTPQVQIWDTSRVDAGAQVGSGGLYNNQKHERIPLVVADNPIHDWNTLYITMIGENVTVYLNGVLVVDNVILENYWDRSIPIFPSGAIELQAHGTDLGFRDVYVREIKSGEYNLSVAEKADGFTSLFNGKNLDGWIGNKTDYLIEEGVVVIRPDRGGSGNLYTEKEYADFNYRFEFQLTPGANNGLGIRTPPKGDAAYSGMELQILDNTAAIYANLQPYQYHGSVYGVIPAKRGFLKPVGEWNTEEVIVQGTRVKVILNGTVIVDGDIADGRDNGTMDHRDHPGLKNTKGHIGFLGHGSVVKFRNIRIKEL